MDLTPITLVGQFVQLIPLQAGHAAELYEAGKDPVIWKYLRYGIIDSLEKMQAFIDYVLLQQTKGTDLPFTVVDRATGKKIGMTRYLDIQPENRSLEIGGTWYGVAYQRTGANTESKYLLLQYAFEKLDVIRVQFKTDIRNAASARALERIGCVREGVLRDHMILPDGTIRSSIYFSILAREWPDVKTNLLDKLSRTYPAPEKSENPDENSRSICF